jgi:FlaA1/EpsC-like NDP-sugar epimerase
MKHFFITILLFYVALAHGTLHIPTNQELFENKNILILGGTGFLGKALITEILKYNPNTIIIYSRDEVKHFNLTKTFPNNPTIQSIIGDIRDYDHLLRVTKNIDIVFHAAALKRIDILEDNVEESIKTNIIGSLNVFNACVANQVSKVIFISTDKACSPVNTYGACKFISEKIFTNYNQNKSSTKCMVARYGNVLDSTGSVIPIFIAKIKNGEDIPLTHIRMTRFIISKEEAVALVFDALRYGVGGEVFIKRLPALKVIDLIEVLKEKYNAHNVVKLIGLRPGEKIHEELINEAEIPRMIAFNHYFIIRPSVAEQFYNDAKEMPIYVQRGTLISTETLTGYSSDQALISKDELAEIFNKLNLLS